MKIKAFETVRNEIADQFVSPAWIAESGLAEDALLRGYEELMETLGDAPKAIIKARTFAYLLKNGRIAVDSGDIFQDKLQHCRIIGRQRSLWAGEVIRENFEGTPMYEQLTAANECGAYSGNMDFGHTSPNTRLMLEIGFPGLLARAKACAARPGLSEAQRSFYEACIISWEAVIGFCRRLADAVQACNPENASALRNIADRAPENTYEAMQLIIVYFFLHEYVGFTRVRTLGRVDVMLMPFAKRDMENGTFTKAEIMEMLKYFLHKFWAGKVPYDLPFAIGGMDRDGSEATNELSYMIVEAYDSLNIYSPKIHVRVSENTPKTFVKRVLDCIRRGNSSFVFINDHTAIRALMNVGIEETDARDYTPIGCYEPAVWGVEVGCTGCGRVNLAKAAELVITRGRDFATGARIGVDTGEIATFEEYLDALKRQITYMLTASLDYITALERTYSRSNPDPLLSSQYDTCMQRGVDAFEGGARYNNSGYNISSIASVVDCAAAVKRLVFDLKKVSLTELFEILKNDWQGHEKLRLEARRLPEKYGNADPLADSLARELSAHCAACVNNRPNGRGGVFKAGLFGIDYYVEFGARTMATPDGRHAGEPLSKNLCAVTAMDRKGITALIHSVTAIDHASFPNGSVLDVVLHPSAVQGEDGLEAFYGVLMTYMKQGGFAMHGNVFDGRALRAAQADPESYKNLQVRVCGWNVYFVNLSRAEQDEFIKQAEHVS